MKAKVIQRGKVNTAEMTENNDVMFTRSENCLLIQFKTLKDMDRAEENLEKVELLPEGEKL